jgi:hypothetical protein
MIPHPIAIVTASQSKSYDIQCFWIAWKDYRDNTGTQLTGEEDLDIFLLELARHFPGGWVYLKLDRTHKQVLDLAVNTEKRVLNYPYWKIPPSNPVARFFPEIVAIVHADRIEQRQNCDLDRSLQYQSIPITRK